MLPTTQTAVKAMLQADPSLTPDDRSAILLAIRNHGKTATAPTTSDAPQILTRKTAAAMLNRSPRLVDLLSAQGILKRVMLPGRTRAVGYRRADVVALIEGGA
ncbi:MAG TPA: hypothetical protein DCS43_07970 [Verrucomicrobia bacterium]|nr:hypothetical protein [Verrucomicrobiota bacterium]